MGNKISSTFCKTCLVSCCTAKQKNKPVLKVVKIDGKAITFTSSILVKDVVARLSGGRVDLSKEAYSENLPLDYELKTGKVYYELPSFGSVDGLCPIAISTTTNDKSSGVESKRVKILITKRQLKELLAKQISVEEVLFGLDKRDSDSTSVVDRSWANRKSKLESIPEEIE